MKQACQPIDRDIQSRSVKCYELIIHRPTLSPLLSLLCYECEYSAVSGGWKAGTARISAANPKG